MKKNIVLSFIFSIIEVISKTIIPIITGLIIDSLLENKFTNILYLILINVLLIIIASIYNYLLNVSAKMAAIEYSNEIKEKAKELGVIDRIRFFGACKEVYAYYSALDVFVLPSVFEGLPVVGIEAQVCGLPSLFADTITAEVGISRNARFIGLDSLENWIREIETAALADRQENIASLNIDSYKIETQSSVLLQKYISLLNIEEKRRKNGKKHR